MNMPLTEFFNTIDRHREKEKRFIELSKDRTAAEAMYFLERWKNGML